MPPEENRVFALLGMLQSQMTSLDEKVETFQERSTDEHRKVHQIIDAQSEAIRNLTRMVEEMKPLTEDYREKRAEARGAAKFATALWVMVGSLIMFIATKLSDIFTTRPHPIVIAMLLVMSSQALARDDGRYANSPLKDWVRGLKDKNGNGCCDTADGYPAEVEWDTEREHYRVRIDGIWYVVPPSAVLEQPNKLGYPMVWYWRNNGVPQIRCFIPGAGG